MSAIHITAEAGHRYLMKDGERLVVSNVTANRVMFYGRDHFGDIHWMGRSRFEREIESVLE